MAGALAVSTGLMVYNLILTIPQRWYSVYPTARPADVVLSDFMISVMTQGIVSGVVKRIKGDHRWFDKSSFDQTIG